MRIRFDSKQEFEKETNKFLKACKKKFGIDSWQSGEMKMHYIFKKS